MFVCVFVCVCLRKCNVNNGYCLITLPVGFFELSEGVPVCVFVCVCVTIFLLEPSKVCCVCLCVFTSVCYSRSICSLTKKQAWSGLFDHNRQFKPTTTLGYDAFIGIFLEGKIMSKFKVVSHVKVWESHGKSLSAHARKNVYIQVDSPTNFFCQLIIFK